MSNILNEINTSCVLSFLAENVNLYNWHLIREENSICAMYDDTGNARIKTCDILFQRAEENNEVCIQLKNTVLKLKLSSQPEEDTLRNAILLTDYIHDRLYYLYTYKIYSENEVELWDEVENTNPPFLYVKLKSLEDIYMKILSDNNLDDMCYTAYGEPAYRICYNPYYEPTYRVFDPPCFGWRLEYLELEQIYITDNLPSDFVMLIYDSQEDNNINNNLMEHVETIEFNTLKVINTNTISVFECPICYDEQTIGNSCITTTCGHHYCEPCFQGMTRNKAVCAMCRQEISEYIISSVL